MECYTQIYTNFLLINVYLSLCFQDFYTFYIAFIVHRHHCTFIFIFIIMYYILCISYLRYVKQLIKYYYYYYYFTGIASKMQFSKNPNFWLVRIRVREFRAQVRWSVRYVELAAPATPIETSASLEENFGSYLKTDKMHCVKFQEAIYIENFVINLPNPHTEILPPYRNIADLSFAQTGI